MSEDWNIETTKFTKAKSIVPNRSKKFIVSILFVILLVALWGCNTLFNYLQTPPEGFPLGVEVVIEKGTGIREAILIIKEAGLIRSEIALYFEILFNHENDSIKASTYVFNEPLSIDEIANILTQGNHLNDLVKITNIEGETSRIIAKRATEVLKDFDSEAFLTMAIPFEGKLFPDTYLIPQNFTAQELFELLTTTFAEKIEPLQDDILKSKLTLDEIIILASIIEREANTLESKKMVSGILQKRLAIDMPLQVDASLEYILNKPLAELTAEDLDIESPYNTYLNYGLPPTPIGNPGLEAIEAVLNPTPSDYLFYITGDDGNFYYAKNFDAHRLNITKYLH